MFDVRPAVVLHGEVCPALRFSARVHSHPGLRSHTEAAGGITGLRGRRVLKTGLDPLLRLVCPHAPLRPGLRFPSHLCSQSPSLRGAVSVLGRYFGICLYVFISPAPPSLKRALLVSLPSLLQQRGPGCLAAKAGEGLPAQKGHARPESKDIGHSGDAVGLSLAQRLQFAKGLGNGEYFLTLKYFFN